MKNEKENRGGARKGTGPKSGRCETIQTRITPELKIILDRVAKKRGVTRSGLINNILEKIYMKEK